MDFNPPQSDKRLENHTVKAIDVTSEEACQILCFMNADVCRSYNFNLTESSTGQHACELNNSTATAHPADLNSSAEFDYRETKVTLLNPITPKGDQCQISPAPSSEYHITQYEELGFS